MRPKILIYLIVLLLSFVFVSCSVSEFSWSSKSNSADSLRYLTGLPSIALGNLSPAARNPGIEVLCTSIYDVPGGYCFYFSPGVPYIDFPMANNFTVSEGIK
jgi:hypothetical protein